MRLQALETAFILAPTYSQLLMDMSSLCTLQWSQSFCSVQSRIQKLALQLH